MTTEIRKNRKPLIIALAVVVLYGVVTFIGWVHYSLFGLHTIQEARSPDGRYVASIMHQNWEGVEFLWVETSVSYNRRHGRYAFEGETLGLGTDHYEDFGYPDEHFLHGKLTWQDNHTLILTGVIGPSGSEDAFHPYMQTWRDVKVIVK